MSSQKEPTPVPAPPTDVVKTEEAANTSDGATMKPDTSDASGLETAPPTDVLTKKDYEEMSKVVKYMTEYKNEDGDEIASPFQRIVNKREYPDYYELIKEPIAFSTIRSKIIKKLYKGYREFVRDIAQIWHNALVYNRPSAPVYKVAVACQEVFRRRLQMLVDENILSSADAELPYLGELPEVEPSPPPGPDDEEADAEVDEAEEEEDEEDEEEEEDDSDDDRPRKSRKRGRRSSAAVKRDGKNEEGAKEDPDTQKRRGRPPKVHTPMEARINGILKGLRKPRNPKNELKILHFEKMPDKALMPEYYEEIKNPIALDLIKKKAKRKKYQSVDQALKDLELMFNNAKAYNLESSQVYKDADDLLKEARVLAEHEKQKPDSDFVDEDGRLPLPQILHDGEIWKVGDWVHLTNANDVTKPIVAQIYRTWQDPEGQKWINACWYYRPEQTVHRYEKHFFENEVVKTGQYRDHKIEELVDRCFVMFFTRYHKGRPRGFPAEKEVYVCEARYNEEKFKLNKIKTWASCVPDEVREKDYEMDLFDAPRKLKKVTSPIKHLLREDAKEDDPLPKPTWGQPNAPPIVGAVHRRPREINESPPPEPTPSPPPPTPEPPRRAVTNERSRYDSQGDVSMSGTPSVPPVRSPMISQNVSQTAHTQQFAQSRPSPSPTPLMHQNSYGSTHSAALPSPAYHQSQNPYNQYGSSATPLAHHSGALPNYQYQGNNTSLRPVATTTNSHPGHNNAYNPPRAAEVYTLADPANSLVPADIREQFQRDEFGKIMFFTTPPLDMSNHAHTPLNIGHSLRYLADQARNKAALDKKRKARMADLKNTAGDKLKRLRQDEEKNKQRLLELKQNTLESWAASLDAGTDDIYRELHGDSWKDMKELNLSKLIEEQEEAARREKLRVGQESTRSSTKITGFRWV